MKVDTKSVTAGWRLYDEGILTDGWSRAYAPHGRSADRSNAAADNVHQQHPRRP
ncbi:MAG TPA: hypothetical protein VFU63_02145 [Ktedonobacterales bacterium]|nr:hypothetical protein [Ktedonobacterales bacterium]